MSYPIKTLGQLRPILQGFRKEAGFTQAAMASQLGITQQSYAQIEANPASTSVERLYKIMRLLNVELVLAHEPPQAGDATQAEQPKKAQTLRKIVPPSEKKEPW
ncbi:helix-turn-helix family protein [Collimonas fungivorans]|uniref:Helix-turn-helix family protein n=1 Tax=Collimonas fungivorans TaxID=158899 RepID=A0A127PJJ1_9BURK|nr:helix-turn-helix transcriptional regulator [Collimonas fungivorans]AMO97958.1 helix-turn-helix family protein [Collimonas fungivorans]